MAVLDQMTYCHCGSPATVVEAAGTTIARTTAHEYELQGKRWKTTPPEGSVSTNQSHVLIVQERNAGHTPQVTYTRGLDLSGTIEGAGGIGGLLMRSHGYSAGNWSTHNAYHSDANGNVTALMNSSGVLQASYKYNPYGGLISSSGTLAGANTMRFSSKPAILSATGAWGFYYYGYRFYDPGMQRWLNQDLIGEYADRNLYRFNYNNPLNFVDPNGLWGIQFGNFNIGWGNPNLAFDNDSWMDLANGAAAAADGLIPFGDPFADLYQNGDIWSDDNEGLSDYERSLYEKSKTGGKVAQVCLTAAAGTGLWNAARLPTMSFGGALPPAGGYTPHFFWSVTTRAGTTTMHTHGRSTTINAEFWGGYLGGPTSITGIPILFPGAAAAAGVTSPNCLSGMCGALRRGIIGF